LRKNLKFFHCSHPDDVDLFTGGMSERPFKKGEILGPTFNLPTVNPVFGSGF
jgi:hypothetical protein